MRRFKLIIITALGALAISSIAASGAYADTYSCTFTGAAGPVTAYDRANEVVHEDGVENIVQDVSFDEGDGQLTKVGGPSDPVTDTDDGNGDASPGGEDGNYSFESTTAQCAYVDNPDDGMPQNSGVLPATIVSSGEYNNYVCGTGWAIDDDVLHTVNPAPPVNEITSVDLNPGNPPDPAADGDITDADYRIDFAAGQGALEITDADNDQGQSGTGAGVVDIEPLVGNCVTTDVTEFSVAGSFTAETS